MFKIFSLRISICHLYIMLIGILCFRSTDADCFTEDPENVVYVCSASSWNNKIVHLYVDKLRIPANFEGKCYCDIAFSANWRSITLLYSSSVSGSCGMGFIVLTYTFECESAVLSPLKPFKKTIFRKTATIAGSACLSISIDHNFPSTNATVSVTCHAINAETSTVSLSSSVSSEETRIPFMNSSTEQHHLTDAAHTVHIPTGSKETSMLIEGSTRKVPPQTGDKDSSDNDQLGIIIGAVGGGTVVLTFTIILIVCCYRARRENAKTTHDYINTASDKKVPDNAVKQPQVSLSVIDALYNTIDDDAIQQRKATSATVLYTNLQVDDDGGTNNTADLEKNHQNKQNLNSVKYEYLQLKDDAGACNTVHFYDSLDIQNNK